MCIYIYIYIYIYIKPLIVIHIKTLSPTYTHMPVCMQHMKTPQAWVDPWSSWIGNRVASGVPACRGLKTSAPVDLRSMPAATQLCSLLTEAVHTCQCESYHVFRLPHSCFAQVTAKPAVCRKPWSHGASKTVHKTLKNSLLWHVYTVSALAECCFVSVQQCSMLHRQIPA